MTSSFLYLSYKPFRQFDTACCIYDIYISTIICAHGKIVPLHIVLIKFFNQ